MTSFCHDIKENLIPKEKYHSMNKNCCWQTILFAFFTFKNYHFAENNKIEIKIEELFLVRLLEQSLKNLKIDYLKESNLSLNNKIINHFIVDSDIFTNNTAHLTILPKNKCCRIYWLKIAFLCIGYLSDPNKNYHLEFVSSLNNIENIKLILAEEEIESKYYQKANDSDNYILYIKKSDDLIHFLGIIGSNKYLLEIENVRIEKGIRNHLIRQINYESANIEKTIESSVKYIHAIEWSIENGFFNELPENLKEVASLRVKYPDKNLRELCELFEKPLTKSGINHRLRRLYGIIQKEKSKVI
ncbi:MAG: DNA-binding protein WhiA [Candidatus Sericytochromatia bacterium]|nr:DNA-binding protein WhiA [Candidatus Sericytochromatia bacterium]